MIPSDELRTLRNDVPILTVIFHIGVPTKRRGRRESFRCPASDILISADQHASARLPEVGFSAA